MSDTVYRVKTVFTADTSDAEAAIARMSKASKPISMKASFREIAAGAGALGGILDGVASGIARLGAGAAAAGIGLLTYGITHLNAEAESTTIAIAGMLQAGGASSSIDRAMTRSSALMASLRRDARDLPGEFNDVLNIFRGGLTGGLAAGQDADHIRQVAGQLMATTQMLGIDSEQAGRDFSMMLEGRAGAQVATFARLRGQIGKTAQEFNALAPVARFQLIERSLQGFGPAIARYQTSWAAVSSTSQDHLTGLLRVGTAPLFERVKATLSELNGWFERNEERVTRLAGVIGNQLVAAFNRVLAVVTRVGTALANFGVDRAVARAGHIGGALVAARVGLGLVSAAPAIGGAVSAMGGVGTMAAIIGPMAAIALPIIAAVSTGAVDLGQTISTISAAGMPLASAFSNLLSASTPLLSLVGVGLVGAFTSAIESVTPFAREMEEATRVISSITSDWVAIGRELNSFHLPDWMRTGTVHFNGPGGMTGVRLWGPMTAGGVMDEMRERDRQAVFRPMAEAETDPAMGALAAGGILPALRMAREERAADARERANRARPAGGNMHVHVKIEQNVNTNENPEILRIHTRRGILEAVQHPIESASSSAQVNR